MALGYISIITMKIMSLFVEYSLYQKLWVVTLSALPLAIFTLTL